MYRKRQVGYIYVSAWGFFVVRSDELGNARALRCGTSNKHGLHVFFVYGCIDNNQDFRKAESEGDRGGGERRKHMYIVEFNYEGRTLYATCNECDKELQEHLRKEILDGFAYICIDCFLKSWRLNTNIEPRNIKIYKSDTLFNIQNSPFYQTEELKYKPNVN